MLEKLFQLKAHNTTVRTEILAGLTTFLTMAYILFVNPSILGETGMDKGAVFVATCLAAAIGSTIMGLIANYPITLAPGMGLNAFFTYTVVLHMGHSWQVALGAVFISATMFFLLSIFRIREWIINSIPLPLRSAIAAGIGLFLALIALQNAGIVVDNPATLIGMGDLTKPAPILATLGFILIVALEARSVTGAVLIGILVVTAIAILLGVTQFGGVVSMPPSLAPTFLQLDIKGALDIGLVSVIFAFLFVDLFDNSGTLIGVAQKAELLDKDGKMPRLGRALLADSLADSQAQVEAAEQAMRRSENKAVQLYAKRVLTEQQEFDHQLRALAGEKALALPSPRQTERQAAAPGGFDERGFLDAQIRQQDRLVARFEGIARDSADPDLRRFADEWLARFYHHRELADQLRSGRAD